MAGRRSEALSDVTEALTIARETGIAFIGPMILASSPLPRAIGGSAATCSPREALLAVGSASHNHLHFRRDAIDACLDVEDRSGAELHSDALETYGDEEPLP